MFQLLAILAILFGGCVAETCKQVYLKNHLSYSRTTPKDGLYYFTPNGSDPYLIYCQFELGNGYTFISTTAYQYTYPGDHNYDRSEFKIVLLYSNGSQYQVEISRPKKSREIDILYAYKSTHNSWLSNDLMYPYIIVSIQTKIEEMAAQGYVVNGSQVAAPACDKESNKQYARLIFGFLFNHMNINPVKDEKKRKSTEYLKKWVDNATMVPDDKRLPGNFFSFFEVKNKNCGGYMTRDDFTDVIGAAIGLKFVVSCGSPPEVEHASYRVSGYGYMSTVTYECDPRYEFSFNNTMLTCTAKGEWNGTISKCIKRKPRTCFDHVQIYKARVSGDYILYDRENRPYNLHCDFYANYTLTFFIPHSGGTMKSTFEDHFNDRTAIVIRSSYMNGTQVESEVRQLESWKNVLMDITYEKDEYVRNDRYGYRYGSRTENMRIRMPCPEVNNGQHNDVGYTVNGLAIYHPEKQSHACNILELTLILNGDFGKSGNEPQVFDQRLFSKAKSVSGDRYMPRSYFYDFDLMTFRGQHVTKNRLDLIGINIGLRHNHS